jgi:glycosyltransferase involved in cell wall biosynthesis
METAMHLVINATEVGRRRGGNESFITGLLEGLADLDHSACISLLTCHWDTPTNFPHDFRQLNLGAYRRLPFFLWQQTIALHQLEADWYLANFFLPPLMPCKGMVAVHDLSFRAHPEYFPGSIAGYMRWLTGWSVRKAQRILTGSEFSRQELLRFYSVNEEKIVTIPYGVGSEFLSAADEADRTSDQAVLSRYGIDVPYILALGNIHPRKNLARLLGAYLKLRVRRDSIPAMVWAGLQRWESGELVERARAAGVILPGFVAQEDLPALYRQAVMLVYPSLYEGFGLPVLEAMACGTPVVASNRTSLLEVAGEAALMIDPTDIGEISKAMAQLLDDASLRKRLQQAGLEQAKEFTWTRTAQHLLASLDS